MFLKGPICCCIPNRVVCCFVLCVAQFDTNISTTFPLPRVPAHLPPRGRRHQLSLYAHVSKITWQFEQRDRVAGTVSSPLRAFDFDPAATPDFEITNTLWDLMGTDS